VGEDDLSQSSNCIDHVLGVVEQKKDTLVRQVIEQYLLDRLAGPFAQSQDGPDNPRHEQ
jgi:hypothetical protein